MSQRRPAVFPTASVCLLASRRGEVLTVSPSLGFLELWTSYQTKWQAPGPLSPSYHQQRLPSHCAVCPGCPVWWIIWLLSPLCPPLPSCCVGQICRCHTKKVPGDKCVAQHGQPCQGFHLTRALSVETPFNLSLATRTTSSMNYWRHLWGSKPSQSSGTAGKSTEDQTK